MCDQSAPALSAAQQDGNVLGAGEPPYKFEAFLSATGMCDVNSEDVQALARMIEGKTQDTRKRAVLAFEYAQNAVLYRLSVLTWHM